MNCTPRNISTNNSTTNSGEDYDNLPDLCDFSKNCRHIFPWSWYGVMFFLAAVTCFANVTSLVVLRRLRTALTPVLRLALMNLSITDTVGSLSFVYHSMMSKMDTSTVGIECKIRYLFYVGMNVVTLFTLIYMTVERLIAVTLPFFHVRIDGGKFTALAFVLIWICSGSTLASGMHRMNMDLGLCIYHVMVPKTTHLLNACLSLPTIVFIVVSNVGLYLHAKKEIAKIGRTLVGAESSAREQLAEMSERAASTTLAVVVPFSVFNTPLYILMLVFYFSPDFMYSCVSVFLLTVFSTLLVLNSLFNPIIYAWKLRPVHAELKKMVPCLARRPAPIGSSSTKMSDLKSGGSRSRSGQVEASLAH